MNFISYAQSIEELEVLKTAGVTEVICSARDFSRDSKTPIEELPLLLMRAKELAFNVIFEWDVLDTETGFKNRCALFKRLELTHIDFIRVADTGVLEYILEHTDKPIHFIRENSDHNLLGLQTWKNYIGHRLARFVLSNELSQAKLKQYYSQLDCEIEILAFGKILLFYTPRNLLSLDRNNGKTISALGTSEESPHKGFPIVENIHGTFMYHIKDLFLLDRIDTLKEMSKLNLRIDLRDKDLKYITHICSISNDNDGEEFRVKFVPKSTRGYFQTNKSDVLFKKLKNYRLQRKDDSYLGEIIEIQNKNYMALMVKENKIKSSDQIMIISPNGKQYELDLQSIKDAGMNDVDFVAKGQIAILKYKGGVWPKSQVYLQ